VISCDQSGLDRFLTFCNYVFNGKFGSTGLEFFFGGGGPL